MTTFLSRMRGSGTSQTRPERGVLAPPLGPARPVGQFAVYPRFVARHGGLMLPAVVLAAGSTALAVYGLWTTIQTTSI